MIKYLIFLTLLTLLTLAAYYGIPRHIEIMETDQAFNECLQDLTYKECKAGIYGIQD